VIPHTVNLTLAKHRARAKFRAAWWSALYPWRRCHQDYATARGARECARTMQRYGAVWGALEQPAGPLD
jgi:hypothetical protein